jgi:hypothetical protein
MIVILSEDNINLNARNFVATDKDQYRKNLFKGSSAQHFKHILRVLIKTVLHLLVQNHQADRHLINSSKKNLAKQSTHWVRNDVSCLYGFI